MINNIILILYCVFNAIGIYLYAYLSIVLLQVILCRHARDIDTAKLFSKALSVRLNLFKRSLGNTFYLGSFCIWIACYIVIIIRLNEITGGYIPRTDTLRPIVSMLLPFGIIKLYRYLGYQNVLFKKN